MAVHRGRTAEQRREQRRAQLVDAALGAIADAGVGGLRVRAISERAHLNDRYFYESFRDCEELLSATFDCQFHLALTSIMVTLDGSPPDLEARTRAVVDSTLAFIDEDPRRRRLLIELRGAEALASRRQQLIATLTDTMAGQVRILLGDAAGSDEHIRLAALTTIGGLLELTVQWYEGQVDVPRTEFIEFVTALVATTGELAGALERRLG